jgi:hypothetical protein
VTSAFTQVRQVVVGVPEVAPAAQRAQECLGLAPGFADPLLEEIGMADECMVLGDGRSFLEYVAPTRPDAGLQRWLDRGAGAPGGYALSVQVSSLAPYLPRLEALGIAVVADVEAYGYRLLQLHPKKVGLLLELDEVPDPDAWFWDSLEKQHPTDPQVDSFASLEITSPDPAAAAALWGELFDVPVSGSTVMLGSLPVTFVAGERAMISGIGLTRSAGARVETGSVGLDGVRLDLR